MRKLYQIIIILSIIVLVNKNIINSNLLILYMIVSLCICILLLLTKNKYHDLTIILYFVISIIYPQIAIFMPLIVFSIIYKSSYIYLLLLIPISLKLDINNFIIIIISSISSFLNKEYNSMLYLFQRKSVEVIEKDHQYKNIKSVYSKNEKRNLQIQVLEERNRIANELHSSIGHTISGSILHIEAIKCTNKDENLINDLNNLQNYLKSGMSDIRSAIYDIKSKSISLENYIKNLLKERKIEKFFLNIKNIEKVDFSIKYDIYHIIEELVLNTVKHSVFSKISINIYSNSNHIKIIYSDDGENFVDYNNIKVGIGSLMITEIVKKYDGYINKTYRNGSNVYIKLFIGEKNESINS